MCFCHLLFDLATFIYHLLHYHFKMSFSRFSKITADNLRAVDQLYDFSSKK